MLRAALAFVLVAGAAQAAMSSDEIKKTIEAAYPVQVLKIEPTDVDGKPAFAVRVMNKASGQNGAFGVTTLTVDADTGKLLPVFRHKASGYALPDAIEGDPRQINVPAQGSKTWR